MRGKLGYKVVDSKFIRITPAGAGKTQEVTTEAVLETDHPRRCGENSMADTCLPFLIGSPPQVRGKHIHALLIVPQEWITPAGAGKTIAVHF